MSNQRHKRGDTLLWSVVRRDSGIAASIVGQTVQAQMRKGSELLVLTPVITDAAAGEFTLNATAAQTSKMTPGTWKYDVEFSDGSGVTSTRTFRCIIDGDVTYDD